MPYSFAEWLKDWQAIADASNATTDVPIVIAVDGIDYEVLSVSRFHSGYDERTPHIETSIREFNDKTPLLSKATRDLGIVRVITRRRQPMFMVEPGADVLQWRSATEGVTVGKLVKVMRAGNLGRRIRRRDRRAAKDSQERQEAIEQEYSSTLEDLLVRLKETEFNLAEEKRNGNRMRKTIIEHNEERDRSGGVPPSSGTMAGALGRAQDRGTKLTSNKPFPGNFEG